MKIRKIKRKQNMKQELLKWKELWLYIILKKDITKENLEILNNKKVFNILENENNSQKNRILKEEKVLNIQKINKLNNWRSSIYKFNKSELINIMINDKLLNNLITKIIKIKQINKIKNKYNTRKGIIRYIFIDNLNIKHYLKSMTINIYYHIKTNKNKSNLKYYNSLMNRLLNLLTNEKLNKSLINILKKIYNKNINLNLVYFKYYYLNSTIFIKKIKQEMKLNHKTLKGYYIIKLSNNIIILNSKTLINNYKKNYDNYINKLNNIYISNINNEDNNYNIFNYFNNNKKKLLHSLLLFKNIGGFKTMLKGKLTKTGRTRTQLFSRGTMNNNLFINIYNYDVKETFKYTKVLNTFKNYISTSHLNYNSRFGTRNIKTSFNYI